MHNEWVPIPEFPDYLISTRGEVHSLVHDRLVAQSHTMQGDLKVSLFEGGRKHTRSVRALMGEAFLVPPTPRCNTVIVLDGNKDNLHVDNLALRPRGFAWRYADQMRQPLPRHYRDLPLMDMTTGIKYDNIEDAGMHAGLLYDDIWRSYQHVIKIFPLNGPFVRWEGPGYR